ncbi:MAG: hypothetical protein GW775_02015 [Candidatus Magasanikbacteria bacterium]|uniref:Uncharacterized protein n=1 Tax=Candidatus Magasanikbacteria bacterium CG10_big_fil_rev_8_21_14_0_10_38_6 TaxID=1974647 RepID=A0A2M6P0X3_9BACT|nr:hypothetical protein [Candidatus Magasanikbacteria bacterium]PIR77351.1 MAG: hypothetical protein COU30_02950 [Candidatus Magasanikbacteria bacterium CG10_big_fil_rev_8_21_14_0_10_38_6]
MSQHLEQEDSLFSHNGLHLVKACPVCKHSYHIDDAIIVDEYDGTELVHLTCSSCQSAMKVLLSSSHVGMSVLGMLTDLGADDIDYMRSSAMVTEDDVLSFHETLQKDAARFRSCLGM